MTSTLRLATCDDGAALAAIYAPSVIGAATSFELEAPDGAEMARRIAATLAYAPWLVLEDDGVIVGYAYASRHNDRAAYQWSINVSVYVAAGRQRRGVGRRLYDALLTFARRQGFHVAHAGITLPNPASVALHEAMGFRAFAVYPAVGYKDGAWRDVGWWRLELSPCTGEPAPPRGVAEVAAELGQVGALATASPARAYRRPRSGRGADPARPRSR
jgi:L-amino acid N-acyltransferase YncA